MLTFLHDEKLSLVKYAKETWKVMQGKFALTEIHSLLYTVEIRKDNVSIYQADRNQSPVILPTVQFKAMLEMFRY